MGSFKWPSNNTNTMKHNNQIHSCRKFRKYWQRYVKTWFNQPARKASRKAALVHPRPVAGAVRPVVHPPTVKYNSKVRVGRGLSLAELKAVKLGKLEARSLGIAVDPRRRNRSVNGKQANEQRLREYKANLVVFPRNAKKTKVGWKADAAKEECDLAEQVTEQVVMRPAAAEVEMEARKITAEEAKANTSRTLKAAWNDARLVGFRAKRAAERAEKAAQEALKKSK